MKKKLLFAAAMLLAAVGVNAQTDVTSTYLTNAGFDTEADWQTGNVAAGGSANSKAISEWTGNGGAAWSSSAAFAYNGGGQINGAAVPAKDKDGNAQGGCLGISVGWGGTCTYYQEVTLPAGNYTLSYYGYNNHDGATQFKSLLGFYSTSGTALKASSKTSFAYQTWEEDKVSYTINEETTLRIQVGGQAISLGSGNNAKVFFDGLTLTYMDPLAAVKAEYQEALAAAQAAYENPDYSIVSGAERDDLEAEIAKTEPTTEEGYEEATAALQEATATFIAAKDSYDGYVEEYAYATLTLGLDIEQVNPANAAGAVAATQALKVQEFEDIAAQYPEDLSATLSFSATFGNTSGQHWNGGSSQYYDSWSGSATSKTLTISATALPAGNYMLKVAGRSAPTASLAMTDGTTTVDFFANGDQGLGIDTSGATNFSTDGSYANSNKGRGWEWRYLPISLSEAGDISVTVTATLAGNSWAGVTKEIYLLAEPNAEISKAALKAAIDQANEVDITTNVGDGVFKKPASAASDFASIIGAAQDTFDDPTATVEDVEATTEAVLAAIDDFANAPLNAPAPDNKYGITIVTEGHPYNGNAIVAGNGATSENNPTGNFFNVKGDSPYLAQTFTFTSAENAEDPNLYYISVELPEGTVYLTNGTNNGSAAGWAPSQIQGTTDNSKKMAFRIAASTTVEGAFNIINTANNYNVVAQNGGNIYTDENAQQNGEFALVEPTLVKVPVAVAAGKFATRIYPFKPAVANDGVVYYSCEAVEENELTLSEVTEPAANVPYILEAKLDVNETQQGYSIAGAATYTDGFLTGVFAPTTITEGYVLQTQEGKQAFYIVNSEPINVPAYRAYLTVSGSDVKSFNLGDDTTGISALEALTNNAFEAIYSADGVKLNRIGKGVNILKMSDGTTRKVILK